MPKESPLHRQSHIPRPRMRSSSSDARSQIKPPGKPGERTTSMSPLRRSNTKRSTLGQSKSFASKMSMSKTPQKQQGRPSTYTPGKSRQNMSVAQNILKDSRALQEKPYQTEMVNVIEEFFNKINQPQVLNNNGCLKPISLKSFVDATKTLLKLLGIPEPLTINNYIEFLPIIAKKLRYPTVLNKSWLRTANAMHSFPSVLGWLSWLTILADAKLMATDNFQLETLPFNGEDTGDHEKFRRKLISMISAYKAWNSDEKDVEEKFIREYYKNEEFALGVTDDNLDRIRKQWEDGKADVNNKIERLNVADEEEQKLKSAFQLMLNSEAEEDAFRESTNKQIEEMKNMDVQIHEEVKEVMKQTENGEEEIKQIKNIISNQEMTVEQRDLKLKAIAEGNDYVAQLEKMLDELQKMDYTMDMKLTKLNKDLTDNINSYRSLLYQIGEKDSVLNCLEIPVSARSDFADLKKIVLEKCTSLDQMKAVCLSDLQHLQNENASLMQNSKSVSSKLSRLSMDCKGFVAFKKTIMDSTQGVMQHFTEQKMLLEQKTEEIIRFKAELEMRKPDLSSSKLKLKETQEKIDALKNRQTFLEQRANQFFKMVADVESRHVQEMNKMFNKFA